MAALGQAKQFSSGGGGQGAPQTPPPPRVNPYKDGISQSAQHYDLFEMIRNPHPSSLNRPPDPPPPGVLYEASLSKQFKIRRELEKKFYSSAKVLAGPAKVVRFIFMILFLPFYLILYRLPQLIFSVIIATLINKVKEYINRLSRRISRFVDRCKSIIKAPFVRIWQAIVREVELGEQPVETKDHLDFFSFIAHGFVLLYQLIYNPIKSAASTGARLAVEAYHYLRKVPGRCRSWHQEQVERLNALKEFLIATSTKLFNDLTNQLYDTTIGRYKRGIAWVAQTREKFLSKMMENMPRFEFKLIYQALDYLKSLRKEIKLPKIKINIPYDRLNFEPVAYRYHEIKKSAYQWWDWIKNIKFNFPFKFPPIPDIQIPQFNLTNRIKKFLAPVKQTTLEAVRFSLFTLINPFVTLAGRLKPAYNKISFSLTIKQPKVTLPNLDRYFQPLKKVKDALVIKVENASMHVRFFIAWAHILVRYGIAQVKEFGDSLI